MKKYKNHIDPVIYRRVGIKLVCELLEKHELRRQKIEKLGYAPTLRVRSAFKVNARLSMHATDDPVERITNVFLRPRLCF